MKKAANTYHFIVTTLLFSVYFLIFNQAFAGKPANSNEFIIDAEASFFVNENTWGKAPKGGDTIFVLSERTRPLKFQNINGRKNNPIVVINKGGLVNIDGSNSWGAITFENCSFIKFSGKGHPDYKYGFALSAKTCGLAFSELSTDCEAENIFVDHEGFFGIYAKKDFGGNPPNPVPVFSNLIIHDCFIQNVTEGMYLGETKSPGMEFKHVRIYNNIVKNTGREAIQIANMVEDVEIYNNTLINSGNDDEYAQNNILQIGDNSVAKAYNNILLGAPGYGIISFGKGNNIFQNNYISSCKGIFIDNRKFTDNKSPIRISKNYFTELTGNEVIKNMNEINPVEIKNNKWDTDIKFYNNASGNEDNYTLTENQFQQVESIAFANPDVNNYALAEGTPSEYENMGAPGGPFTIGKQETEPVSYSYQKIELTHEMIIDEVEGGSYHSPAYLVDEQNCSPENELHPLSESWKPHWNMDKAPYHVIIDLKEVFQLGRIAFHDMHNVANLEVSWGEPGSWNALLTETCDKYKTWKNHIINVKTRYIRLTMNESVYAAVNEIAFYKVVSDSVNEKSAVKNSDLTVSNDGFETSEAEINLYPNPAIQAINIDVPAQENKSFKVEIYDLKGNLIFNKDYSNQFSSKATIDLTNLFMEDGVYCLRYSDDKGGIQLKKFIKGKINSFM